MAGGHPLLLQAEHVRELRYYEVESNHQKNTLSFVERKMVSDLNECRNRVNNEVGIFHQELEMNAIQINSQHEELLQAASNDVGFLIKVEQLDRQRELSEAQVAHIMRKSNESKAELEAQVQMLAEMCEQSESQTRYAESAVHSIIQQGQAMQEVQELRNQLIDRERQLAITADTVSFERQHVARLRRVSLEPLEVKRRPRKDEH